MLEGEQPNASALPGGRVGVYTGMLQVAGNEAQLATVSATRSATSKLDTAPSGS